VLIVEDSETCAETLQIALESLSGLEPRIVPSLRDAIKTIREKGCDVAALVTDFHLGNGAPPHADGIDLIRQLRADPQFATLPIVLISGDSDPRLPDLAVAHGASAFFPKPYSPAAVRKKLEQLIC
jgi:CheY-like chemotaxis protein